MSENINIEKQFIESYDELSDAVFRHCFFRVSDREVALDLMQETFTKTWRHIQKGNDIHDVRAFVYRVANNMIIDYYRKKKSLSLDKLSEDEESSFEPTDDSYEKIVSDAESREVREFVAELEEPYRQAVTLRYIDGLPPQDIAEIVGESANNVSVRITRGLEKLREKMK